MRVAILANSVWAAWKVYSELSTSPEAEPFVLVSPVPDRPLWKGYAVYLAQLFICMGRNFAHRPLSFVKHVTFLPKGFNHKDSIALVKSLNLDVGLHKSGIIYREGIIDAFRLGILNPHIGILPSYRGRHVMEWSLLKGDPVGITVFFIDSGIDTGSRIVVRDEVDISQCGSVGEAKQYLFDQDVIFFKKALAILREPHPSFKVNDASGRRHYVMSKLFQGVVERILERSIAN